MVSERGNGVCNVDAFGDAVNKCLVKPLGKLVCSSGLMLKVEICRVAHTLRTLLLVSKRTQTKRLKLPILILKAIF